MMTFLLLADTIIVGARTLTVTQVVPIATSSGDIDYLLPVVLMTLSNMHISIIAVPALQIDTSKRSRHVGTDHRLAK